MGLQDFIYLPQERIDGLSEEELENYIKNLKVANYRKSGFLHSPVLTSNTYPIIQGIELNNIIINYCEERLKEIKEEDYSRVEGY